jgi:hypothetical protein
MSNILVVVVTLLCFLVQRTSGLTTGCVDKNTYGDGSCCRGDIEISTNVVTIGLDAFASCSGLTSVAMPSVKNIGGAAFVSTGLVSVTMPSVETIGSIAFEGCSSLVSITLGESVTRISGKAFGSTQYSLPPCGNTDTTATLYVPASIDASVYSGVQGACSVEIVQAGE